MRTILPHYLQIKNFLSYEDQTIEAGAFRQGLVTSITGSHVTHGGSNGAGKSAPLDALTFVLYGTPARNIPVGDVVRTGGSSCRVVGAFHVTEDVGSGSRAIHELVVERSRTRVKAGALKVTYASNVYEGPTKGVQDVLDKIIGVSKEAFLTTVMMTADFRFSSLTDRGRRDLVREVLGLSIYEKAATLASQRKNTLCAKTQMQCLKRDEATKRLSQARDQVTALSAVADAAMPPVDPGLLAQVRQESMRATMVHQQQEAAVHKLESQYVTAHRAYQEAVAAGTLPPCSKCHRPFTVAEFESALAVQAGELNTLYQNLTDAMGKTPEFAQVAQALKTRVEEMEEKVGAVGASIAVHGQIADQIAGLRAQVVAAEDEIESVLAELDATHVEIAHCDYWVRGFGRKGVQASLLDMTLPVLTNVANRAMAVLDDSVRVSFATERQGRSGATLLDFHVTVETDEGAASYAQLSKGQQARVDVAVWVALSHARRMFAPTSFSLLVIDDALDGVDTEGLTAVTSLLEDYAKTVPAAVWVATHRQELAWLVPNNMHVERDADGVSRIVRQP